jgi:NADPH:quinone reductase-like Zn-dependent oxidoreductase/thioesterase domain-containing protein/NAD(P)-dependent dehydrogenase (short-subunit alcohol dehydrogenase family)/acyl carrier protein
VLTSLRHPKEKQSDSAFLLTTLGRLWLAGIQINWSAFYAHEQRYRLPLPTYPFERKRYWIDPPIVQPKNFRESVKISSNQIPSNRLDKKPNMADWFYVSSWKRADILISKPSITESLSWLVFINEDHLGFQLIKELKKNGQDVITVTIGKQFNCEDAQSYTLNPQKHQDYHSLLKALLRQNKRVNKIIHLWTITHNHETRLEFEDIEKSQIQGFYSLLFLAQAIGKQHVIDTIKMYVLSNFLQRVTPEETLHPEKATLLGPCKVIPQEYPNITCCSIDIVLPESDSSAEETLINQLLSEFIHDKTDSTIAYRDTHRLVENFEAKRLEKNTGPSKLRKKGVYLITGGLGGIGLTLAEYLAKTVKAKLILIQRSVFPPKNEWQQWLVTHNEQDSISQKIKKVHSIESLGSEVLIISADITDIKQMQTAITHSLEDFGQIHGVIHSAGIPGGGVIQRKTQETVDSIMTPKVKGTLVLDTLFKNTELDFFVLCSSLASIEGGFGQVDYCAANAFLNAFAQFKGTKNTSSTVVSIAWDGWQEIGMAVEAANQYAGTLNIEKLFENQEIKEINHPLFDKSIVEQTNKAVYITYFSVLKHWVIAEHKVMGKATLPGTAYLEMARAAFENYTQNNGAIEFKEIYLLAPLTVAENEEKEVRTVITKMEKCYEFVISSQLDSERWQEHATGKITSDLDVKELACYELKSLEEKCQKKTLIFSQERLKTSAGFIEFGPRWNNLKQIKLGDNQGLALLELPNLFDDELNQYPLHPALLDVATGFTQVEDETAYLPFSYKRLRMNGPLPNKFYSYIVVKQNPSNTLHLNIEILDEHGRGVIEIEEYTLRKIETTKFKSDKQLPVLDKNFHLEITSPGLLDTLVFQPATRQTPRHDEVEIEVSAVGLNFKEVLWALDMLPTDGPIQFGLECAGKIVGMGENVNQFKIDDEVIAFVNAGLSAYVTTPVSSVMLKPQHLTMEEGATIPIAFMTAYYALSHLGRLSQGERVLIHAAAGGVGLAAVQVAQFIGAEIFATAGNPEKRAFLRSLGIQHVMNSRTLEFAETIMKCTNGQGVNVVLNSLAGEFIAKSLSVLAPFGRFLEIGKRDIYENTPLGLQSLEKSLSLFVINIGTDMPQFNTIFNELVQHFKEQHLKPLPYRVFSIAEVGKAFEYMARAKHIGKIVISLQDKLPLKTLSSQREAAQSELLHKAVVKDRHDATNNTNIFQKVLKKGLLSSEGIEVFNRILHNQVHQIFVSTWDLEARLERDVSSTMLSSSKESTTGPSKSLYSRPQMDNNYVAPRNELEQTITGIWQRFLGIETVGVFDNFFDLGADSLMLVQLVSELNKTLEVKLSAHSLLENATIAALAESIEAKLTKDNDKTHIGLPQSLVEIQVGDSLKQPIFLVHPIGGQIYLYRDLAPSLGIEQPVYAFKAKGIEGETQPISQIEQMAAQYLNALRLVQPEGPYILGGHSFGGLVAFEMAQQLQTLEQEVALLFMMDTVSPEQVLMGKTDSDDVTVIAYALGLDINIDLPLPPKQFNQLPLDDQIRYYYEHSDIVNQAYPSEEFMAHIRHFIEVIKANTQAMNDYVPKIYHGKILFFRAQERDQFLPSNPEQSWIQLATEGVDIHDIPGNHTSMNLSPNVEVTAHLLKSHLHQ